MQIDLDSAAEQAWYCSSLTFSIQSADPLLEGWEPFLYFHFLNSLTITVGHLTFVACFGERNATGEQMLPLSGRTFSEIPWGTDLLAP